MSRDSLVESISSSMQELMQNRARTMPEPWLHLDLTLPQLKALFLLDGTGPARPSTIAEAIGVTPSGITGLIDRLESRQLVRREADPRDRRAQVIALEPAGQALVDEMHATRREHLAPVLERMNVDDLRALDRGLRAVLAEQGRMDPADRQTSPREVATRA